MSRYKNIDLFGSGPHRFRVAWYGEVVLANMALGRADSGSTPIGPAELDVIVEGRLIGSTWSELKSRVDAIVSVIDSPPTPGMLVDDRGVNFENMSLIRFEPMGRPDPGRVYSLAFTAVFRRFIA